MNTPNVLLRRLPLAVALALACHAATGADIHSGLAAAAQRDGQADALIILKDQERPRLVPLSPSTDYKARRRALVDALRDRAEYQQASLRAWLDARGIAYRAFWITNMIQASLSTEELAELAAWPEIDRLEPNVAMALRLPEPDDVSPAPEEVSATEWGINKINAPAVWAEGITGQGVVIAGQDTGIRWEHNALKAHYRGWNGTTADHNYNWHDGVHATNSSCSASSQVPCDDDGHGTHTIGTMVGDDGGSNQIGVAPGAKFIGCRNMNDGWGTPAIYTECMQWMLAPTNLAGQNPNPDLAPDIISNSWGCVPEEGCTTPSILQNAVSTLVDAGIFFVAAAGNDGSSCSTIFDPPAIYDDSFVVGATNTNDAVVGFSSRGPVAGAGRVRPDIVAPGNSVRSSVRNSNSSYTNMSGTSMATPHVAGVAALMMSANPSLKGKPELVGELLRSTAQRTGITDPSNPGCGGLTMSVWPNHQAGHGRVDAYAAVMAALAQPRDFADGFEDQ